MWPAICLSTCLGLVLTGVSGGIARAAVGLEATPSETGSTGLYRMSNLDGVGANAVRLAVFGELTRSTNLLVLDDVDTRLIMRVAAAVDVDRRWQLFASWSASYNRDQQPIPDAQSVLQSAFVQTVTAGAKALAWRNDIFSLGGELGARLPLGGDALPDAISGWLDALGSANLWSARRASLRAHLSFGYYLDNAKKQFDLTALTGADVEVLMFEHAIGSDRVRSSLGLDGTFQPRTWLTFRPFVEYHLEVATGPPNDRLLNEGLTNVDGQWLTVGLKAGIGPRVAIEAGVDLAIRSPGFAFGPPLPPLDAWAGVAVPFPRSKQGPDGD
jgi:hypothetical protein